MAITEPQMTLKVIYVHVLSFPCFEQPHGRIYMWCPSIHRLKRTMEVFVLLRAMVRCFLINTLYSACIGLSFFIVVVCSSFTAGPFLSRESKKQTKQTNPKAKNRNHKKDAVLRGRSKYNMSVHFVLFDRLQHNKLWWCQGCLFL